MNIPIEIVAGVVTVLGGGILTALGFIYSKLTRVDVRIARIEERMGILSEDL